MAGLIPIGMSEIIQDAIVAKLQETSDEQKLLDPNVGFFPKKDLLLNIDNEFDQLPLVNVWIQQLNPSLSRSAGKLYEQEIATYNIDLYVKGDISENETPDVVAFARLKYLKEQVKHSLMALINVDFGLEAGIIGSKKWPSFQFYQPSVENTEDTVPTGRWTLEVDYAYSPDDIELEDLDSINIKTSLWEAFFQY